MITIGYCEFPFTRCRVTCEGWVTMCCFMRKRPNQTIRESCIGNVLENSFEEIWFGYDAKNVRQDVQSGTLNHKCQSPGCPFLLLPRTQKQISYNEYPTFLEIDLPNSHCNIGGFKPDPIKSPACVMCERSGSLFAPENSRMPEILDKLKPIMRHLNWMHIQGVSEPFYKDMIFEVLDQLEYDHYKQQIQLSTTTNGTLFKKQTRLEYLKRAPSSHVTFSIDAATPETYRKIRILDCFDKVIDNLFEYCAERQPCQTVSIHNNINLLNIHEVIGMVHIANNAKVDKIEFNPTNGHYQEILVNRENSYLFKEAQTKIEEECKKLNLNCEFLRPLGLDY